LKKYFLAFKKSINSISFEWSYEKVENTRDIEKIFSYQQKYMYFSFFEKVENSRDIEKIFSYLQEINKFNIS
jgi:hypothetical protein